MSTLSGGQRAKVALAGIELSRFDITLLDEPTNDLDFDGLRRLETWVRSRRGGMVIVSHDRDFLERTVTTVLELDAHSRTGQRVRGRLGRLPGGAGQRPAPRHRGLRALRASDGPSSRAGPSSNGSGPPPGSSKETRRPRDNDKAQRDFRINRTEKLAAKARQTDRAREALEVVDKPWEGWDLRFTIEEAPRAGTVVARLTGRSIERGGVPDGAAGPRDRLGRAGGPHRGQRDG